MTDALPVAKAPMTSAAISAKNSMVEILPSTLKPDQPTDTRSRSLFSLILQFLRKAIDDYA
jgi:hypothetical protein